MIEDYENKIKLHEDELIYKDSQIESFESKLSLKNSKIKNMESILVNNETEINNLNNNIRVANNQVTTLKQNINQNNQNLKNKEIEYNAKISEANSKINLLKSNISQIEEIEVDLKNQLQNANFQINNAEKLLTLKNNELMDKERKLNSITQQYVNQLSKLDNKEYCINCFKEEINNNQLEIEYLKNENLTKKLLSPFGYLYLIFKSNPKNLHLNFRLYKAIKNSKCFDVGFYLNNNEDIKESKWCKYFSPELHYVCNGFDEKRKFNKKYFNRNSKKELLEYILNCEY